MFGYTICSLVADLVCVAYSINSGRFCRGGCGRLNRFVVVTSQQQPLLLASEQKGHIKKKWEGSHIFEYRTADIYIYLRYIGFERPQRYQLFGTQI